MELTDLVQLRFYTEYQWLLDFALYSMITYSLSELYIFLLPERSSQEANLSLVWVILVILFTYKLLLSLNGLYFEGEESAGERAMVMVMGGSYLLLAMMVMLVDEATLETGLESAYVSFNNSAAAFLENNTGLDSSGPASKLVLKFFIALWCGLIGALFTFPGLRVSRMHWDVLRYSGDSHRSNVLYHIGFIAPLLVTTLWVRPLTRDPLTVNLYKGMKTPLMSGEQFETVRLYLVCLTVLYRLLIMPTYLQAYLNIAYDKVMYLSHSQATLLYVFNVEVAELKQEAGKISNLELQRKVVRVFYYLCVVTLQYTAPMILILYLTFLYKTLGGGSWAAMVSESPDTCEADSCHSQDMEVGIGKMIRQEETVEAITQHFSLAWISIKQVMFDPQ